MNSKAEKYILVVDDKKENIDLLCAILKKYGYNYLTAFSGEESIDIIDSNKNIGLILMDVKMKGIDGTEAMHRIKEKIDVPVIAVTGFALESDKKEFMSQGFDDYISKPIDIQSLNSKISDLLQ
ncbi:MAG: response regulator [Spirochaetes bacterium]|nr:response regulator [Spirochaetota bacterium]